MADVRPAPYPADTRAKGWRFELDMELARQSDTWTLAPAEARPWLLMMWATAWEQTPCGSMPNDDALISARLGMPSKLFAKYRSILMRKWWLADDGRLYHDVLVRRVSEMMQTRRKESDRKTLARQRMAGRVQPIPAPVPRDTGGTDGGFHPESDTGTGTGTGTKEIQGGDDSTVVARAAADPPALEDDSPSPTMAGRACLAMRGANVHDVNPAHPDLLRLLAAGVTPEELGSTAAECAARGKPRFAYVLATVERRRAEAAQAPAVAQPPADPMAWRRDSNAVLAKGEELGVKFRPGELINAYTDRVVQAYYARRPAQGAAA